MRTINVKGKGRISSKVDSIIIYMDISVLNKDYELSIKEVENSVLSIKNNIEKAGFLRKDIKTRRFDIDTSYNYKKQKNESVRVFEGYQCQHNLIFEFDYSNENLSLVLNAITSSINPPEFRISFSTKDKNRLKKELLKEAVEDGKAKAEILAEASNVTLGDIININYSWSELYFKSNTKFDYLLTGDAIDIEPEDIELEDTVDLVWEIK